ncbi:NUDIX domain-containing protein [Ornithinibacillus sp. L9]|uniref:NUDIX domain-containing protein n=1 Tax=Ornithinibacillus caprae TaxID=2678566 RepID=A0A6N8FLH8_9BACI|nr:CoA pyrophosphatase [Ornithinibacillus caprae]MUK88639.1 NUDIX domain-containing protein [Ornithinibacillus caprae]
MDISKIINTLKDRKPSILGYDELKKSAVLLPLVEVEGKTHVLFEVRSMNLRSQPGDICFPGGRIDPKDSTPQDCAIRETTEELGIPYNAVKDIIPLDYIVSDFGRIIYPFVGKITNPTIITPNESEVGEVFTVPLSFFLQTPPESYKVHFQVIPEENFPFELIVGGKDYNWQVRHINELFYKYEDKVIWGLTAKILTHFLELIRKEIK